MSHYESHGVRQLRLPTVDTTSPSLESVMLGVSFIRDFMDDNPDKRVFIHCKGARRVIRTFNDRRLNQRLGTYPTDELFFDPSSLCRPVYLCAPCCRSAGGR